MTEQVTIISGKGGTGKTSITSAIATLLGESVMVDADVETGNMSFLIEPLSWESEVFRTGKVAEINENCIECGECIEACAFDAISDEFVIDPLFCEGCGACVVVCPADAVDFEVRTVGEYIQSTTEVGRLFHAEVYPGEGNSGELVTVIRRLAESYAEDEDVKTIIIDGSPGTGCPVIASITGVDLVIIVTEPTQSALSDMKRVVELIEHFEIPSKVIINKSDLNREMTKNIEKFCDEKGIEIFGEIPYDKAFVESVISGQSIVKYAPDSDSSEILREITSKIIEELRP